jgi:large subunit ribosomal protein L20
MARIKRGVTTHARHRKIIKLAKGYRGRSSTNFRVAIQKVEKALRYAYRDRRARKRNFRALWIQRINAGARQHGLTYSQFMNGMKLAGVELDRKIISDLAISQPNAFKSLVETAQKALGEKASAAAE